MSGWIVNFERRMDGIPQTDGGTVVEPLNGNRFAVLVPADAMCCDATEAIIVAGMMALDPAVSIAEYRCTAERKS